MTSSATATATPPTTEPALAAPLRVLLAAVDALLDIDCGCLTANMDHRCEMLDAATSTLSVAANGAARALSAALTTQDPATGQPGDVLDQPYSIAIPCVSTYAARAVTAYMRERGDTASVRSSGTIYAQLTGDEVMVLAGTLVDRGWIPNRAVLTRQIPGLREFDERVERHGAQIAAAATAANRARRAV